MSLLQDLRFAVRLLLKDRWFTIMAAFVLALGIGANNAVFTLVNAVLIRSMPVTNPSQIMMVSTRDTRGRQLGVSLADFQDWQSSARTFSHLSFIFNGAFIVSEEGRVPEQYSGPYVSANFFKMLDVTPEIGRDFGPDEARVGGPAVVILGHALWQQRYGGDPSVLGRTVRLNGLSATIIGVMKEGMAFPFDAELWMPESQLSPAIRQQPRQARGYGAIGRLADGVTLQQARTELSTIGAELARQYPDTNKDLAPSADPFEEQVVGSQIRLLFLSLMGAVGFVLLIACSNVANLLLARAARRTSEIAVRVAIGATRWQIVRQLLIESVLLSFVAGVFGLLLSIGMIRWFDAETQNVGKPYWMEFTMDWRTFAFFLGVCLVTGIIFGLAPALHVARTSVSDSLKEGARTGTGGIRARRWAGALIVAELALTLALLAGAGFMMRSFVAMYRMDIGVDTSQMLAMSMIIPGRKYPALEDRATFLRRVDEHLSTVTGIEAATTATNVPFGGGGVRQLEFEGRRAEAGARQPAVTVLSIGPRYFDALDLPLVQGRVFTDTDGEPGRESAIVNQRLVSLHFAGQNPIGQRIRLNQDAPSSPQAGWATIIGVSRNVRQRNNNQEAEPDPVVYIPHLQNDSMARNAQVIARTRTPPAQASQLLREGMMVVDPDMALANLRTLDEQLAQQRWVYRIFGTMFTAFAVMALLLSAVGLYAVTAYSVAQYTREIGVRMLLGAQPGQVVWLFLRRACIQLAIGLTIGLAAAYGVGRLLQSLLVQTVASDPLTLGSIAMVLVLVAMVASLLPARRATRVDPLVALRYE